MEKKICAFLFTITFVAISTVVHGSPSIHRGPSVDPIVEVDIEDAKSPAHTGYDFAVTEEKPAAVVPKRVPANIVTKADAMTATSMAGPIIFLIALPIGLWIIVSKKFSKEPSEKAVGYYPKTQQFKPYTTDYQKSAEDDDDIDYPKAS